VSLTSAQLRTCRVGDSSATSYGSTNTITLFVMHNANVAVRSVTACM
jgi:hypothetical protein